MNCSETECNHRHGHRAPERMASEPFLVTDENSLEALRRDIARGYRHFWRKRGGEPGARRFNCGVIGGNAESSHGGGTR